MEQDQGELLVTEDTLRTVTSTLIDEMTVDPWDVDRIEIRVAGAANFSCRIFMRSTGDYEGHYITMED